MVHSYSGGLVQHVAPGQVGELIFYQKNRGCQSMEGKREATLSNWTKVFDQVSHWVLPGADSLNKHYCLSVLEDTDSTETNRSKKFAELFLVTSF